MGGRLPTRDYNPGGPVVKIVFLFMATCVWASPMLQAQVKSSDVRRFQKRLTLLVRAQRVGGLNDLIGELAELDDPKVVVLIPPAAVALPSAANYKDAVEAIAGVKNEKSVKALISLVEKRSGDVRQKVLVLEAFGKRDDKETLEAIVEQLESKLDRLRIAAIQAGAARRDREVIPVLIRALADTWKARDRVWLEIRQALVKLTGQDFDAIEDWKKFWESSRATFDPKKVGKEEGPTSVAVKRTEDSVEFFGSEIFSRNLVFVIDISLSMVMYDDSENYQGSDIEKDRQRLKRAKDQLSQALRKLERGTRFNIITFCETVVPWQKRMQTASGRSLASALTFVSRLGAKPATYTDDAMKEAFKDLAVDTIVLMTDGAPVRKDNPNSKRLVEQITKWVRDVNASRKIRIDTFGFEGVGTWPEKVPGYGRFRLPPPPGPQEVEVFVRFLKTLAAESGGSYRAIK